MFTVLNDGRKVNMFCVCTFFQRGNEVVYETVKNNTQSDIVEVFESDSDAAIRVQEFEDNFMK